MIDYIKNMLNDTNINNKQKLKLLISFKEKVKYKMLNKISHSSELLKMNETLNFINSSIKDIINEEN